MVQKKKPTADRSPLTAWALPAVAVALALGLRIWFILEMRGQPFSTITEQTIDSWQYHVWAMDILHRSFWGTDVFFLLPLYPYLLAALYRVFGVGLLPVQLFQAGMAAASCLLLFDLTRRIFGRASALFAAFGFALTGILVFYTGTLLYVELTVFLSLLSCWLLVWAAAAQERQSPSPLPSPLKGEGMKGNRAAVLTSPSSFKGEEIVGEGHLPGGSKNGPSVIPTEVQRSGGIPQPKPRDSARGDDRRRKDGLWRWVVAGLALGLLVICRPEMLVLLPAVVVVLLARRQPGEASHLHSATAGVALGGRGRRQVDASQGGNAPSPSPSPVKGEGMKGRGLSARPLSVLVMALAALAVVAVVPVRNYIVARDPVLFTGHSGVNFYYGWNPSADGTWQQTELERTAGFSHEQLKRIERTVDGRELSWSQASSYWTRRGLSYIVHNPGRSLWLLGRKFLLFFSNYEVPNNYYPETVRPDSLALKLAFVNYGLVLALGLVGIVLALRRNTKESRGHGVEGSSGGNRGLALLPLLFVLAFFLSSLAFYVLSRLRAPVMPFLLVFAGYAAAELVRALRGKRWRLVLGIVLPAALLYAGTNFIPVDRRLYTSQAWTQAGNIYLTLGSRRAFDAFGKAVAANPGNPVSRYGLFVALAGMGKLKEAQDEYLELLKVAGIEPRTRVLAEMAGGRLAVARRDFAAAAEHYQRAVELDPLNAENYYLLGLVYVSLGDLPSAEQALAQAVALDPAHEPARSALERIRARLGNR